MLSLPLHLAILVASQQQQARPGRDVPDPGVIATQQRVTPAGVQTVFTGRVGGVRFGRTPEEVWVAAPGSLMRRGLVNIQAPTLRPKLQECPISRPTIWQGLQRMPEDFCRALRNTTKRFKMQKIQQLVREEQSSMTEQICIITKGS